MDENHQGAFEDQTGTQHRPLKDHPYTQQPPEDQPYTQQTPPEDQPYTQPPPPQYEQYQQQPPPGYQGYQPPPYYQQPYGGYEGYNRPVGFIEAYVAYWKNYANFNDRTSRAGYWWVVLMNFIIGCVLGVISSLAAIGLFATAFENPYAASDPLAVLSFGGITAVSIISSAWSLVNLVPGLAISVRRLHDVGRSWPWILINLIPVVGTIIYIVFVASAQKHPPENQFGYLRQV